MKTVISKILGALIAAAIVLNSGFITIPKPAPSTDNPTVIIETEPDSDDGKIGNHGNEDEPQFDDTFDEIDQ